jgi:hypothetical protein
MNRRNFLRLAVSAGVAVGIPVAAIKHLVGDEPVKDWAIKFLNDWYWDKARASGGKIPGVILVGSDLFDAYESQLQTCMRFTDVAIPERSLKFKALSVKRSDRPGVWIAHAA